MSTITQEQVVEALREVFDPEIPVNVYDLGLVYGLDIDEQNNIGVTMTLTGISGSKTSRRASTTCSCVIVDITAPLSHDLEFKQILL
jgi:hypothetical protein